MNASANPQATGINIRNSLYFRMFKNLQWHKNLSAAAFYFATFGTLQAAELVMFERAGCSWCARWDREIGPIYPKTPEGIRNPLRRVNLDAGTPADIVLKNPVRFTPTFVVVNNGREIGRITGYINDESFWGLLRSVLPPEPSGDKS